MFEKEREWMVSSQIVARGVLNREIADAMRAIPRHEFISQDEWSEAYEDHPVPIGFGQTISQPYVVAYMLELVLPSKEKRLLEIGSGCGYLLAVASLLYKEVVGVERVRWLYENSLANIQKLQLSNVSVFCSDGYEGQLSTSKENLFESIIVSCSCSAVPPPLLNQLAPGGVLVAPVGDSFFQELLVMHKGLDGAITTTSCGGVRFVPLISSREPR